MLLVTEILPKQISLFTEEPLTCLPEDSHVNHSPLLDLKREQRMTVISGRKCLEQLEKFNQVGSLAKTFTELLIGMEGWYSTKCRLTWKLRGTKCGRMFCQLVPSMPRIGGIASGLLPTPMKSDSEPLKRRFKLSHCINGVQGGGAEQGNISIPLSWPIAETINRDDRIDDGLPYAVDRLGALGNAIAPHVALQIFKAIKMYSDAVKKR